eukprot:1295028-Prymnesium_polylepis.1
MGPLLILEYASHMSSHVTGQKRESSASSMNCGSPSASHCDGDSGSKMSSYVGQRITFFASIVSSDARAKRTIAISSIAQFRTRSSWFHPASDQVTPHISLRSASMSNAPEPSSPSAAFHFARTVTTSRASVGASDELNSWHTAEMPPSRPLDRRAARPCTPPPSLRAAPQSAAAAPDSPGAPAPRTAGGTWRMARPPCARARSARRATTCARSARARPTSPHPLGAACTPPPPQRCARWTLGRPRS